MIRTLLIVSVAGAVLAAVCFGGAAAVGWRPNFGDWNFDGDRDGDRNFYRDFYLGGDDDSERTTREIPWQGGDELTFNLAGTVHYTQGPEPKVTVTGPQRAIDAIEVDGGEFTLPRRRGARARFDIEVTAPNVTRFNVNGPANLTIENYAQDELRIEVNGPGNIVARGAARRAEVELRGPGNADLSGIIGDETRVEIMGPGDARIAPKKSAEVTIMGPGNIYLSSDTAQVRSTIMGPGQVHRSPSPASSTPESVKPPAQQNRAAAPASATPAP